MWNITLEIVPIEHILDLRTNKICGTKISIWLLEQNARIVPLEHNCWRTNYCICSSGTKLPI